MTVKELMAALEHMNDNAHVYHIWDGEPRTSIDIVFMSEGRCMTIESGMTSYTHKIKNAVEGSVSPDSCE